MLVMIKVLPCFLKQNMYLKCYNQGNSISK